MLTFSPLRPKQETYGRGSDAAANPGLPRSLSRAPSSICQLAQAPNESADGAYPAGGRNVNK